MKIIRKRHTRSREEIKDLFITLANDNGLGSSVQWEDFAFTAKGYGTSVQGEIFDDELHVEIKGVFENRVEKQLRDGWKKLVLKGLV